MTRERLVSPRRERGSAAVEFALVLPAALALVGLVLFAGWLGAVKTIVVHGARQGAAHASIPVSGDLRSYPDDAGIARAVDDATPLITPTVVTVTSSGDARNAPVRVDVTYRVPNPVAALFAPLGAGDVLPATIDIRAGAEVRRE